MSQRGLKIYNSAWTKVFLYFRDMHKKQIHINMRNISKIIYDINLGFNETKLKFIEIVIILKKI